MASSVAECEELLEIAEGKSLTLMIGHTFVYSAPVQRIKEIIDSGDLGQVQYISSQRLNLGLFQKDINVAWDLAPHDISIILYIMKEPPVSVNCQGKAHVNTNIEDVTNMTLNFAGGGLAIIQSSWLDPNKVRKITVVGNKKMLVYDDVSTEEQIRIYDKSIVVDKSGWDSFGDFQFKTRAGDVVIPNFKMNEPLKVECQHFLDCIKRDEAPISDGIEGLKVLKILNAAQKSLKEGGKLVKIQY